MWEHPFVACVGLTFFGVRGVFGLDACHLFPQHVLAITPLIGGVQAYRCTAPRLPGGQQQPAAVGSQL